MNRRHVPRAMRRHVVARGTRRPRELRVAVRALTTRFEGVEQMIAAVGIANPRLADHWRDAAARTGDIAPAWSEVVDPMSLVAHRPATALVRLKRNRQEWARTCTNDSSVVSLKVRQGVSRPASGEITPVIANAPNRASSRVASDVDAHDVASWKAPKRQLGSEPERRRCTELSSERPDEDWSMRKRLARYAARSRPSLARARLARPGSQCRGDPEVARPARHGASRYDDGCGASTFFA